MMDFQIAGPRDFEARPETVQLPSQQGTDKAVRLRRPDLVALVSGEGDIPDLLSALVLARAQGQASEMPVTRETLPQVMEAINVVCKACFVEPQLWDEEQADETHVPVSWLSFADRAFVFAWALGAEYQPAASFRGSQSNGHVDAVQPGAGMGHKAKRGARTR